MTHHEHQAYAQLLQQFHSHGRRVVTQVQLVLDALQAREAELAQRVIDSDDAFDAAEIKFEADIFKALALYQPAASDLRMLMSCIRVNTFFERLADHAVNLARLTLKLHLLSDEELPEEVFSLCERIAATAERALDAFVTLDVPTCEAIANDDVYIDRLDKALQVHCEQLAAHGHAAHVQLAFILYRCGRELERMGDIIANWCETTIFMATGHDIRHRKVRLSKRA